MGLKLASNDIAQTEGVCSMEIYGVLLKEHGMLLEKQQKSEMTVNQT